MVGLNWVDTGGCGFNSHKKKLQRKYECVPNEVETIFIGEFKQAFTTN